MQLTGNGVAGGHSNSCRRLNINTSSLGYDEKTFEIAILLFLACEEAKPLFTPDNRRRLERGVDADAKIGNSEAQATLRMMLRKALIV